MVIGAPGMCAAMASTGAPERLQCRQSPTLRHRQIEHHHVGFLAEHLGQHGARAVDLAHDLHVRLPLQHESQPLPHDRVIIGKKHLDRPAIAHISPPGKRFDMLERGGKLGDFVQRAAQAVSGPLQGGPCRPAVSGVGELE